MSAQGSDAAGADVVRLPDGAFHVTIGSSHQLEDQAFSIVVF